MIPNITPLSNGWDNLNETIFQNLTTSVLNTLGGHSIIDIELKLKHHFLHREKRYKFGFLATNVLLAMMCQTTQFIINQDSLDLQCQ